MKDEKDGVTCDVLTYYKNQEKKLHIKLVAGNGVGGFRNGFIININEEEEYIMFDDAILGSEKHKFNEISNSIKIFTEAY